MLFSKIMTHLLFRLLIHMAYVSNALHPVETKNILLHGRRDLAEKDSAMLQTGL
jgi:hypothetical protein